MTQNLPDKCRAIYSPVNGIVRENSGTHIQIYIAPDDEHWIFSPTSALITDIFITEGEWNAPIWHISNPKKYGRFTFVFDNKVKFWVEVGKAKYITDTVEFVKDKGETVKSREYMGEIIIGSLAGLSLENGRFTVPINRRVVAGQTIIGITCQQ